MHKNQDNQEINDFQFSCDKCNDTNENTKDVCTEENIEDCKQCSDSVVKDEQESILYDDKLETLQKKLEEKEKEIEEYKSLCQRVAADFDNYKKRIAKDKENMYFDVVAEVVGKLLPIVDNFERAINSAKDSNATNEELLKGLEMIKKQIDEIFTKLGVEPIEALNKEFDPFLHNAIMHVEDERFGKNIVVEELQKGYKIKDRVIRYSLVKVANAN